jgi:hypothetical protein
VAITVQSNIRITQPLSLFDLAASSVVTRKIENAFGNQILKHKWDVLKAEASYSNENFGLNSTMLDIERSIIELHQDVKLLGSNLSEENVQAFLQNKVLRIFTVLGERFHVGLPIPFDCVSYVRSQQLLGDRALMKLWNKALAPALRFYGPVSAYDAVDVRDVKAWIKDPANAPQLNRILELNFSEIDLKVIPFEITCFTQLQKLDLGCNNIRCIPAWFGNLAHLQDLNLGRNQIAFIPDSFANLSRLESLDLGRNQITFIPDSFANLSQLRYLALGSNWIKSIPDFFDSFPQLQIRLENNPVNLISRSDQTSQSY